MRPPTDLRERELPARWRRLNAAVQGILGFLAGAFVWAGIFRLLVAFDVWPPWYLMPLAALGAALAGVFGARRWTPRVKIFAWAFLVGTVCWALVAAGAAVALLLSVA